ncbi:MAG: hypothetical protein A3H52_00420 [Candidatus Zambryskibacteria bacterium RIFCSPLOWO2_02_FULL_39_26]|nr:MAG: hypothetical protein A3H52_00420 [Candidatus Zambryskibacteria bacterium RIFCSPLOWO2_02_FULL_39_26]
MRLEELVVTEKVWVFAIIYRYVKGRLEFLLQESQSVLPKYSGEIQMKFVGGGFEPYDENHFATLSREIESEIFLSLKLGFVPRRIHDMTHRGLRKIGFLVPLGAFVGKIREVPLQDGTDMLLGLYWYSPEEAERKIYSTHKPLLRSAVWQLTNNKVGPVK